MAQMYLEEKIDLLILEQTRLMTLVELFLPNLEDEKGVIHFLEITKNTFNTYIRDGYIVEGYHFIKKGNKRAYIPDQIVKLKKSGIKGKRKVSKKEVELSLSKEKLEAVNRKLGIMPEYRSVG